MASVFLSLKCRMIRSKLKDRVGRYNFTLDSLSELKDRVWTIQFNSGYLSKLKDRDGRYSLTLDSCLS